MSAQLEPEQFELAIDGASLAGEEAGKGPALFALHGLSATRRYVVHGSRALPRAGYRLVTYDARGHGASDPPGAGAGYSYAELVADLARVVTARADGAPVILAGHSMGAHTLAAYALEHPGRVAAVIAISPAVIGTPPPEEALERWDRLADGLERGGVDGFIDAFDEGLHPQWRETILRFTRTRIEAHRHPEAVAQALREVPRSLPFDGLSELEQLDVPALVVASHDEADAGHAYSIAEAWAERMPQASLISEETGESPLAWQGGRLSRKIADFCSRPEVRERLDLGTESGSD